MNDWYSKFPSLTPWFPPNQPPVRPGVYMVDQAWRPGQETEAVFSYWDGNYWHPQGSLPDDAIKLVCYGPIKARLFRKWRGLLKGV